MQFIVSFCLRRRIEVEHTGLLFLFTCQPTKSSNFSRSDVNVRAHLLRMNYSRNFSSIRNAPRLSESVHFMRFATFNSFYFDGFSMHVDKISMGLSTLCFKGSPVEISKHNALLA